MRRVATALALLLFAAAIRAQEARKQFDVVSIRESLAVGPSSSNFPLNPGPQYNSQGGLLTAHSIPLLQLLVFAYARSMYQIIDLRRQLPPWAREKTFDVQARADGSPTKDDMRAMVRTLLEDRFRLKLHTETREMPALRLELVHAGRLGPNLRPHPSDAAPCAELGPYGTTASVATVAGGFPAYCGILVTMPGAPSGEQRFGGRNLTPKDLAFGIGAAADFTGRPVVDATELTGTYDALLEFTPDNPDPAHAADITTGISLNEALRQQLGLKLESGKAPVEVYVLDHVEKPGEN